MDIIKTIKSRRSWRSYSRKSVEADVKKQILKFIAHLAPPPFGSETRFQRLDLTVKSGGSVYGTYGIIKGAQTFVAGAVTRSPGDMEDFGYQFEKIILFATAKGLDTCWMGLTFSTPLFSEKMGLNLKRPSPASVRWATEPAKEV